MERFRKELKEFVCGYNKDVINIPVSGEGAPGSLIMMIGEAPGEQETILGRPFVGKAGKNLDEFLSMAELDRQELYVTNVVKYRPIKHSSAGRLVNRPPTRDEVRAFLPWLLREIDLVHPKLIVTLGNVPLRALIGEKSAIGNMHGQFMEWGEYVVFPMYHPASVIYNPSLKEIYHEDIRRLSGYLKAGRNAGI